MNIWLAGQGQGLGSSPCLPDTPANLRWTLLPSQAVQAPSSHRQHTLEREASSGKQK